jgi:hypothetical protein
MEDNINLDNYLERYDPQINIGYYIAMRGENLIRNQVLEEILRERANHRIANNEPLDAWIAHEEYEQEFGRILIDAYVDIDQVLGTKYYSQNKAEIEKLDNPKTHFSYLYSSSIKFITWIRLRLGYFEDVNKSLDDKPSGEYISDGLYGRVTTSGEFLGNETNESLLNNYIVGRALVVKSPKLS